ncbi:hypothetical protein BJX64DRAFT_295476, partial [Aspergillus heterothallicus]
MPSNLFTPLHIGNVTLAHRVVMAPLTRLRADADHVQLPITPTYYAQRASVPGTLLIAEAVQISAAHGGAPHLPGIYTDAQIAAWKTITDAVHAKGSYIFAQVFAPGRAADPDTLRREGGYELVAPSAVALDPARSTNVPREMTEEEIQGAIGDFATAAKNAIAAGFYGVEVHGANGYL